MWQIRVDVHILQADGALIDCASVAAITALAHFRRPDVTVLVDSILVVCNSFQMFYLTIYCINSNRVFSFPVQLFDGDQHFCLEVLVSLYVSNQNLGIGRGGGRELLNC